MLSDIAIKDPERHKYINALDKDLEGSLYGNVWKKFTGEYYQKIQNKGFLEFENLFLADRPEIRKRVHAIFRDGWFQSGAGRSKVETIVCSESKKIVVEVWQNDIIFRRYNSNEFTRNAENKICHHNGPQNVRS